MFDFKTEMPINPWSLDEELVDQGRKIAGMIEAYGESLQQRDRAKLRCEVVYASLSQKVRRNPAEYGLSEGRPSDKTVENVVLTHPSYIKARQRHIKLLSECEVLKHGVGAFQDRSMRIGKLIQLHLAGYYGRNPQVPVEQDEQRHQDVLTNQRELLEESPRMKRLRDNLED